MRTSTWRTVLGAAVALALAAGTAPAQPLEDEADAPALAEPTPLVPQPAAASLAPGLEVVYYDAFFRHVDEIVEWKRYRDGKPGPTIPRLDYKVGDGTVLTSTASDGVGAEITGLIHLAKSGSYWFAVESNDGVRVTIGGARVLDDPDVHADRFSDPVEVYVTEPGWYPIHVLYFERKVTSTLRLHWQEPGDEATTMPVVPAEAFAHVKGGS